MAEKGRERLQMGGCEGEQASMYRKMFLYSTPFVSSAVLVAGYQLPLC